MSDTLAGRLNMGPINLGGNSFDQSYNAWAAPLTGPLNGRQNQIKLYTNQNQLILDEELYFQRTIEAILPDTISIGSKLSWNADENNPHGILLELSNPEDSTLNFDDIGISCSYFYFPQDDGNIELSKSLLQTFGVADQESLRLRLYRGNFEHLDSSVDYPKDIKFMYWSSVYKMVCFEMKK